MSGTFSPLRTAFGRRAVLRRRFDVANPSEDVEESCVVFYSHWNPLVAFALDSLEHNDDVGAIAERLARGMADGAQAPSRN